MPQQESGNVNEPSVLAHPARNLGMERRREQTAIPTMSDLWNKAA
jgi:hypothetical protein